MTNITVKNAAQIGCGCGGELRALQAVRAEDDRIFIVGTCEGCGKTIPVEVDEMIASLYTATLVRTNSRAN